MANIYKALEYKFKHYIHNIRAKGHTDLTTLGKKFKTDKVGFIFIQATTVLTFIDLEIKK